MEEMLNDFEIIFYQKHNGKEPTKDFLMRLNVKARAKMLRTITLLEENGNELHEPFSKHLDDGIFELRTQFGENILRILYFFYHDFLLQGNHIILTHGFKKKTNKTPQREIDTAKRYRNDYLSRRHNPDGNKIQRLP